MKRSFQSEALSASGRARRHHRGASERGRRTRAGLGAEPEVGQHLLGELPELRGAPACRARGAGSRAAGRVAEFSASTRGLRESDVS